MKCPRAMPHPRRCHPRLSRTRKISYRPNRHPSTVCIPHRPPWPSPCPTYNPECTCGSSLPAATRMLIRRHLTSVPGQRSRHAPPRCCSAIQTPLFLSPLARPPPLLPSPPPDPGSPLYLPTLAMEWDTNWTPMPWLLL